MSVRDCPEQKRRTKISETPPFIITVKFGVVLLSCHLFTLHKGMNDSVKASANVIACIVGLTDKHAKLTYVHVLG